KSAARLGSQSGSYVIGRDTRECDVPSGIKNQFRKDKDTLKRGQVKLFARWPTADETESNPDFPCHPRLKISLAARMPVARAPWTVPWCPSRLVASPAKKIVSSTGWASCDEASRPPTGM